jgi:hypothetical protein
LKIEGIFFLYGNFQVAPRIFTIFNLLFIDLLIAHVFQIGLTFFFKIINGNKQIFIKNRNLLQTCLNHTVGNRVAEIPGSDSSKLCFLVFYSIVNTPTKKKSKHKIPCCPPLFWYRPSKSKLCRICHSFFATEGSTLDPNISASVRFLFSIYILNRKVF